MSSSEQTSRPIVKAPFQVEDLEFLSKLDNSAQWSQMGCFKTSTVLWWLEEKLKDTEAPKMLIITTRSGKGTYWKLAPQMHPDWEIYNVNRRRITLVMDDIEIPIQSLPVNGKHPKLFISHYDVFTQRKKKKSRKAVNAQKDLLKEIIDEYGGNQGILHELLQVKWDAVVLDEAHRIKSRKTGWTKNIKKLKARYKHVMTGTGFINRPDEIWSLFHFLEPRIFTSYWRFREKFCEEEIDWTGFRRIVGINKENEQEFRELVRSIGPRRTKSEVFADLPDPVYTPVEVELNKTQRLMYDSIRDHLHALDQKGVPIYAPNVLSALQRLRQVCVATPEVVREYYDEETERRVQEIQLIEPSSKLDALMEILEGLEWDDERRDQVVVFSNFKDPIRLAKARFDKAGITYLHMEEKDNDRIRYEKWGVTFPKKEHQVFICTLQLGSESIDLTTASTAVFLDRSWSPAHNEQGVARLWRPPQKVAPNIIHINAKDTVDDHILAVNEQKLGWFKAIFG